MFHLVKFLAGRFEVDLVAPAIDGMREAEGLLKGLCSDIEFVPLLQASPLRRLRQVGPYAKDPALQSAVHRRLERKSYGAVHVEKPAMLPYLPATGGIPLVLDTWAYGLTGPMRALRNEPGGLTRARNLMRLVRFGLFDTFCWPQTACILVVSEEDRLRCQRSRPGRRVLVIPNGVDCAAVTPKPVGESAKGILMFSGDLGFEPNVDAALFLASQVFPEIRRRYVDAELRLVGRNPDRRLRRLVGNGVMLTGEAPNMVPHLHAATIYVAPHFTGAGTRTKLLEAMAAGLPIVTTTIGIEGIAARPGREMVIADSSRDMVTAIRRLLDDPEERQRLGSSARRLVEERYDWSRCLTPLESLYRGLKIERALAC